MEKMGEANSFDVFFFTYYNFYLSQHKITGNRHSCALHKVSSVRQHWKIHSKIVREWEFGFYLYSLICRIITKLYKYSTYMSRHNT